MRTGGRWKRNQAEVQDKDGKWIPAPPGSRFIPESTQYAKGSDIGLTKTNKTALQANDIAIKRAGALLGRAKDAIKDGIGPWSAVRAGFDNLIGGLTGGALNAEQTTVARQHLREFRQIGKAALVNNPKFPVAEQKNVDTLFPDPDTIFRNPRSAARKIESLNELFSILADENASITDVESAIRRVRGGKSKAGSGGKYRYVPGKGIVPHG